MVIPKSQAWFYSEQWQKQEAAVDRAVEHGDLHEASGAQELLSDLGLDDV